MQLSHKKVFNAICKKYNLTYRKGQGGYEPTNYHMFEKGGSVLTIEIIPAGKYLKTIYCMVYDTDSYIVKNLLDDIQELYTKQRKNTPVEWCMDFNTSKARFLF